ncbi:Xylanase [Salix suchowensis]|nr:Xylanase [Salix suchowensis]
MEILFSSLALVSAVILHLGLFAESISVYQATDTGPVGAGDDNVILNPRFEDGLNNWSGKGCKIELHESMEDGKIFPQSGKFFASATNRTEIWNGIEQDITGRVQRKVAYQVTAVVRIHVDNVTSAGVQITLWLQEPDFREQYIAIANSQVTDKDWVQLQGEFLLNGFPSRLVIYLEGPSPGTDILVNSLTVSQNMIDSSSSNAPNIILNHDFSRGLHSWHPNCCDGFVLSADSGHSGFSTKPGGNYAVVSNRKECWQGLEQDITSRISPCSTYSISASVGVSGLVHYPTDVLATLKLEYQNSATSYLRIGKTSVSKEGWEKLGGTFSLATIPDRVVFYLEGPAPGVDLLVESVIITCSCPSECNNARPCAGDGDENIILNPKFEDGLNNWSGRGCKIVLHDSMADGKIVPLSGKVFASATDRTQSWNGIQQEITERVQRKLAYEVTAVVRIFGNDVTSADIRATLWVQTPNLREQYIGIANLQATDTDWVQLQGKFLLNSSPKKVVIYIEGPPAGTDILVNSFTVKHAEKIPPSPPPVIENPAFGVNIIQNSNLTDGTNIINLSSSEQTVSQNMIDSSSSNAPNIILNHDFSRGLHSWHPNCCDGFVLSANSGHSGFSTKPGGNYAVVSNRKECWQGLEQDITSRISPCSTYSISASVGVSGLVHYPTDVLATLKLEYQNSATSYLRIGKTSVSKEGWEKLGGTFSLATIPDRVVFYLEGPAPGVDLLVESVIITCSCPSECNNARPCAGDGDENIILNPKFEDGLNNWSGRGCKIVLHDSMADGKIVPLSGKVFASATDRTQSWNGIQQEITERVQRKLAYEVTAVVRIFGNDVTSADIRATLWVQTPNLREQYIGIANLQATDTDWVQLQGKFLLNSSPKKVVIYIEGPPAGTDILVNSFTVKHAEKIPPSPPPVIENPAFGVNIIQNSNLTDGTNGWFPLGNCSLNVATGSPHILPPTARDSLGPHEPLSGCYILATKRTQTWMGPAQMITDKIKLLLTYQVSAWAKIGSGANGPQNVNVALGVDNQWVNGGQVEINDDRWHEISGSFRIEKQPSKVMVYVQGPAAGVDLMLAGLQIFPVDRKSRFKHLRMQTDKIRKRDVTLKFSGGGSSSVLGTFIKVRQMQNSFPFGSCMSRTNLDNEDFVHFFVKNFNWAVFGNELKWYWTEPQQGNFNYSDADEMLDMCKKNNIEARGHCIFWEVDGTVQQWIKALNKNDMMAAVQNHLTGLLTRYKGKFRHYDVNNEMLHGSFYQDHLGKDIRANMFKTANQLDPSAMLFVNDYHVEDGCDTRSSPEKYIEQILDLQEQGAPVGGIGIQGHIDSPVGPVVSSALLDVSSVNEYVRGDDLEVMLREAYAHPAVDGIMLWGFWELFMSRDNAHLVNAEGELNEAGKRYLALKKEWLSRAHGHIDEQGQFAFRGFHGTYVLEIETVSKKIMKTFVVDKGDSPLVVSIDL